MKQITLLQVFFYGALLLCTATLADEENWSFDFQDIKVRTALQLLAEMRGLNLVAGDDVEGQITLHLENVPWEKMLQLILDNRGLQSRRDGDVLLVRRREKLYKSDTRAEGAVPRHLPIRFADATEIAALLNSRSAETSNSGQILVDARTNALLLYGSPAWQRGVSETVGLLDVPVRQVMISAMIAIVNADHSRELGLQWRTEISENAPATANSLRVDSTRDNLESMLQIGFSGDRAQLLLALQAMEQQGFGEVISRPRLITGDRRSASIKSGIQIPFQESAENGRTTVQFKDAVLRLDVKPFITPDDKIILELVINQDSPGSILQTAEAEVPTINTTELRTRILVAENETVALGGVLRDETLHNEKRVPFLGSIPVMGRLFRSERRQQIKTETLIFITPQILPGE